jgi:hypothetical protein
MIELSTTTKVTIILAFDPPVKLHFLPKNTIHNFSYCMLQPLVMTTIPFVVIRVCSEIDSKFELRLLIAKDIRIVSF